MLKTKSSHQVEVQESVDKTAFAILPTKAILPAKFDTRRQLKYNVQPDWSKQIITIYMIGQFEPVKWYDIISLHGYHFYSRLYHTDIHT